MTDTHIILAGQSNALGYLNTGAAHYIPTARVQIWTDTDHDGTGDAWNYMLPGVNTGTLANPTVWGPEVAFANDWLAANPTGYLWIDKVAKGSTGLAENPTALDWSPNSTGEMFDFASASVDAARHNLDGSPYAFGGWDGVLWMQGETDATSAEAAGAYQSNLHAALAEMRQDWDVENIAVGRIGAAGAYSQDVRVAQWAEDQLDPAMASFKTLDFGLQPDGLHYNEDGQLSLGHGFFNAWAAL